VNTTCSITETLVCVHYSPRADRNVALLRYLYGREGEVCLTFTPFPQTNRSMIAAMNWTPTLVFEKTTGQKKKINRTQKTIIVWLDDKTQLLTDAIIFNLGRNFELNIVKRLVQNGVGELAA
jgi:hypothetical protein